MTEKPSIIKRIIFWWANPKFSDPLLEEQYLQLKAPKFRSLLDFVLILGNIFTLTYLIFDFSVDYTLPTWAYAIFVAVSIFGFFSRKKLLNHPQTSAIIFIFLAIICGLISEKSIMGDDSDVTVFYTGYQYGILIMSFQLHLTYRYLLVFHIGLTIIRSVILQELQQSAYGASIVFQIVAFGVGLQLERLDRQMFLSIWEKNQEIEKYKDLLQTHIPQSVLILGQKEDLKFQNKAFKVNFGDLGENLSLFLTQFLVTQNDEIGSPSSRNSLLQVYKEFRSQESSKKESRKFLAEHEQQTFEVTLFQMIWDSQDSIVFLFNDVSLNQRLIALKIADDNKQKVIACISHELKTPINTLMGTAQIMKKKLKDTKYQSNINLIFISCNLLMSKINSLIDLQGMRDVENKIALEIQPFTLRKCLSDVSSLFQYQCKEKKIKNILEIDERLPDQIYSDKARFEQILINLLTNAVKFTQNGFVKLTASLVKNQRSKPNTMKIEIEDTGIGMDDDQKQKAFKMFGKLEDKKTVGSSGIGLGLNVAYSLIQALTNDKGCLTFESAVDKGSVFSFELEISRPSLEKTPSLDGLLERSMNSQFMNWNDDKDVSENLDLDFMDNQMSQVCTSIVRLKQPSQGATTLVTTVDLLNSQKVVMVVDDDPFNIMIARKLLEQNGYKVEIAYNGKECIKRLEEIYKANGTINMILMDLQMPVMDGFECTKELQNKMKDGELPTIPIVALSANNDAASVKQCKQLGMKGFLPKPLIEKQMLQTLKREIEGVSLQTLKSVG